MPSWESLGSKPPALTLQDEYLFLAPIIRLFPVWRWKSKQEGVTEQGEDRRKGKGEGHWVLWSQGRLMCMSVQGNRKSLPYQALIASVKGWVWLHVNNSHGRRTQILSLCGSGMKWLSALARACVKETLSECDFVALLDMFHALYSSPLLLISQQPSYYLSVRLACAHCCQLL